MKNFIVIWDQIFNVQHIAHIIKVSLNDRPGIRISTLADATSLPNERFYDNAQIRDDEFNKLVALLSIYRY
jgi:hypothetical protein